MSKETEPEDFVLEENDGWDACPVCRGSGITIEGFNCEMCDGTGEVEL